jgi:REP element-mobilizing transposase RayT
MARPLRLQFSGGLYHVTARGNDRQAIFRDDLDCSRFLEVLTSVVTRYRLRCHAYCLMGNHYHLLLETPRPNLSLAMRQLNGVYAQRFNRRHERCGHILQGRFGAQVVGGDVYLHEVCRYIVLNPVRAGLVSHPRAWPWSSFAGTAGEAPVPGFLTVDWVLDLVGPASRVEAARRYVKFVEEGLDRPAGVEGTKSRPGAVEAGPANALSVKNWTGAECREIPRAERFAHRPALEQLFAGVRTRAQRDDRAVAAVTDYGYTMREVAEHLGRHYITVSRALARADKAGKMSECKT